MQKIYIKRKLDKYILKSKRWKKQMGYQTFIRNQGVNNLYIKMDKMCDELLR